MGLRYKIATIDNRGYISYEDNNNNIDTKSLDYLMFNEVFVNDKMYHITAEKYYFFLIHIVSGRIIMPYDEEYNNGCYEIWWDENNSGIRLNNNDNITLTNFYGNVISIKNNKDIEKERDDGFIRWRKEKIKNIVDTKDE